MPVADWLFYLVAQIIILVIYYFHRHRRENFELKQIFQSRTHFLAMNLAVILSCCYFNIRRQLFCVPVPWTLVVLALFCACFLAFPFVNKRSGLFRFVSAFAGLGPFLAVYIILFGREEYAIFAGWSTVVSLLTWPILLFCNRLLKNKISFAFLYLTAFTLAPYLLILQSIFMYRSLSLPGHKRLFASSSLIALLTGLLLTFQIKRLFEKTETSLDPAADLRTLIRNPVNNYLVELMLGAHWKYHTQLCLYDGWRPPFHDPVLVVANKILFPFEHFGRGTKLYQPGLYQKIFPHKPLYFNCRCAVKERLYDIDGVEDRPYHRMK